MCNIVFGDDNRLWFRNLLDNLRFHAERVTKLSSAVGTSIFRDIHVPIRLCRRSRHALMSFLLPRLLPTAFIRILFALAATLQTWWGMCVLIHGQFGFEFLYTSFKQLGLTLELVNRILKLFDDRVLIHRPLRRLLWQ